jgi:hypothetical protein
VSVVGCQREFFSDFFLSLWASKHDLPITNLCWVRRAPRPYLVLESILADRWPGTILRLLRPLQIQPDRSQLVPLLADSPRPVLSRSSEKLEAANRVGKHN